MYSPANPPQQPAQVVPGCAQHSMQRIDAKANAHLSARLAALVAEKREGHCPSRRYRTRAGRWTSSRTGWPRGRRLRCLTIVVHHRRPRSGVGWPGARCMGACARRAHGIHPPGQGGGKRLHREFQRQAARRMPERTRVPEHGPCPLGYRALAAASTTASVRKARTDTHARSVHCAKRPAKDPDLCSHG